MKFRPKQSRHTAAGTFRTGFVYSVDDAAPEDKPVRKAIAPHIKSGLFEVVKGDGAKGGADVSTLGPEIPVSQDASASVGAAKGDPEAPEGDGKTDAEGSEDTPAPDPDPVPDPEPPADPEPVPDPKPAAKKKAPAK